ncbi:MAG: hypothetical protein PWP63_1752 [Methanolobus sp.]|nr:hypothetical protein [Methanolobus sp.]
MLFEISYPHKKSHKCDLRCFEFFTEVRVIGSGVLGVVKEGTHLYNR